MQLPNPYEHKHYRLMVVVPLAMMVLALFFIPRIPAGIDLKGGTLISIQTTQSVDAGALKVALSKYSKNVDVRQSSSPTGVGVEIELESSEALEQAEEKLAQLLSLDRQLSDAELQLGIALSNNQTGEEEKKLVGSLQNQINSEIESFYNLVGRPAVSGNDGHELVAEAQKEFAEARDGERQQILAAIQSLAPVDSYSFKQVGSSLSKFFVKRTQEVVLMSFLLGAIVVFLVFRSLAPSFAVIFGAVADITMTAGAMGLLGIPLSLATVATLLMLIGFSLDTDIMLTMRVLKRREGQATERAYESMKTGFLMNLTTIGAFGALLVVASWLQIPTYAQIGAVAVIGGIADFFATWFFNAPLILWAVGKRETQTVQ